MGPSLGRNWGFTKEGLGASPDCAPVQKLGLHQGRPGAAPYQAPGWGGGGRNAGKSMTSPVWEEGGRGPASCRYSWPVRNTLYDTVGTDY